MSAWKVLKRMNKLIVCEGVETKEQLDALVGSKVQLIQGFYFGKPMKAEMFERQYL